MNVWNAIGNLGADAETKQIGDGVVTEFPFAASSGYGERKKTTWARCQMWGKRGEAVAPYLVKGAQVGISGELTLREYEKTDGGRGYSLDVRLNDLKLLGKAEQAQGAPQQAATPPAADGFEEDSIPF